jgi:hypothetical protein
MHPSRRLPAPLPALLLALLPALLLALLLALLPALLLSLPLRLPRRRLEAFPAVACPAAPPPRDACEANALRRGLRCGPASDRLCPWRRRGDDLCCVQRPPHAREGVCTPCADRTEDERSRTFAWTADRGWIMA